MEAPWETFSKGSASLLHVSPVNDRLASSLDLTCKLYVHKIHNTGIRADDWHMFSAHDCYLSHCCLPQTKSLCAG